MENETHKTATPTWFWLVAALIIIWNAYGVAQYLSMVSATPDSLMELGYTEPQTTFFMGLPAWSVSIFALAVFSGVIASILLLMRKGLAVKVMLIQLVFVALSFIGDGILGAYSILGSSYLFIMIGVLLFAVLQYVFARKMQARGVLS